MAKKSGLPIEIHDHFSKANTLHTYVEKSLGEASISALETGNELLAAKSAVPHGRWEDECSRLFNGSARTARGYMEFAKHMGALPKRQNRAILMLEGTLDGAAKAAKAAAKPKPPKPDPEPEETDEPIDVDSSPATPADVQEAVASAAEDDAAPPDYGKCPNCASVKWKDTDDGVECAKCQQPFGEPAGDADEDRMTTQRQKTVKTAEALMRAFDDLQTMKAQPGHGEAIKMCKVLIGTAKEWK